MPQSQARTPADITVEGRFDGLVDAGMCKGETEVVLAGLAEPICNAGRTVLCQLCCSFRRAIPSTARRSRILLAAES
jgi:hypothetical protein